MTESPIVELRAVKRHFERKSGLFRTKHPVRAVDGVSLAVAPGESLGIVGESGCGKTTLARLMLNLDAPTEGSVHFRGRNVASMSRGELAQFRRNVQAVFQDPYSSLSPRMRVGEIVAEPMRANLDLASDEIASRVRTSLSEVGLDPSSEDQYPHKFSGGQRQRVAVARAIAVEPRLIILDEPTSSLDVSIRSQVVNLLRDLQRRHQLSYVVISHDLTMVRHIADRVAVMYLGKVVELATNEDLFERPAHPYTRMLFDAVLPADPDQETRGVSVRGEPPSPVSPPSGCSFHPRCPEEMPHCSEIEPRFALRRVREPPSTQLTSCHLHELVDHSRPEERRGGRVE